MKTIRSAGTAALTTVMVMLASCSGAQQGFVDCTFVNDVLLENGKIITVDDNDSVISALRIRGNRIAATGDDVGPIEPCTQLIDLEGRTVIPGLIDHHNHWLGRANRPGHHVAELDSAFTIAEVLSALEEKARTLPAFDPDTPGDEITADDFITSIGGWDILQFDEGRMPTLEELDTIDHPVFLSLQFDGPGQTNTAGKRYFEVRGITVGPGDIVANVEVPSPRPSVLRATFLSDQPGMIRLADGQIGQGGPAGAARRALAAEHDSEDVRRNTAELMVWSASLGLTMNMDEGGGPAAAAGYLALHDEGGALTRLRMAVGASDSVVAGAPDRVEPPEDAVPNLAEVARNNIPGFGSEMVRFQQIGENIAPLGNAYGLDPIPANYDEASRVVARYGWSLQQHSIGAEQGRGLITIWEDVNREYPITDLRWSLAHIFDIGVPELDRLHALGAGAALHSLKYTTHTYAEGVPPYRTVYNHPIPAGAGTDGGNITTINPWGALYFMTTGLNVAGEQVLGTGDDGETVTRRQALEMYTKGSAWISFDEDQLGSLEVGKLADLAILSADYDTVSDEDFRKMTSVLTIVDGRIVYSDSTLVACNGSNDDGIWYPERGEDRCISD